MQWRVWLRHAREKPWRQLSCSCFPPFPISPAILGRFDIRRLCFFGPPDRRMTILPDAAYQLIRLGHCLAEWKTRRASTVPSRTRKGRI
jgi:hypothetical protein